MLEQLGRNIARWKRTLLSRGFQRNCKSNAWGAYCDWMIQMNGWCFI